MNEDFHCKGDEQELRERGKYPVDLMDLREVFGACPEESWGRR